MSWWRVIEPLPILEEYDRQRGLYSDYGLTIQSLIRDLLAAEDFHPHSVQQRIKDRVSLARKILANVDYLTLSDLTDVLGIRVITYFADEVDVVAEIVKRQFKVHKESNKRSEDPNEFGYRSLRYVVGLNAVRAGLPEYKRFSDLKCEIQIRSILDHAWAEIEHDKGYKGTFLIPPAIQKRFSELAAFLGNIDRQFQDLRDDLQEYGRTQVWKSAREEGLAEPVGDIMLEIRKEQFPQLFQSSPWDLRLFLNTNLTTRIIGEENLSDARAFVNGATFVGHQDSASSLIFREAIQEKTRELGVCSLRVANVRVNAFQLGRSDAPITATVEAQSGATGDRIKLADHVEVGRIRPGLTFRVCEHGQIPISFSISDGINNSLAADPHAKDATVNFELCFREGFRGAFRTDLQEAGTDGAKVDFGTRLVVRFNGLPDKVEVYATATELSDNPVLSRAPCKARLIVTEINGNSASGPGIPAKAVATAILKGGHNEARLVCLERSGTTAWAVWEWVDGNPGRVTPEEVRIGVVIAAKPGAATTGIVTVTGEFAPLSNVGLASFTSPIPRFGSVRSKLEVFSFGD